jgi:hypothetical protein
MKRKSLKAPFLFKMSFLKVVTRVVFLFVAKVALGLEQVPLSDYTCTHPPYSIHIFSKSPLVIYISNFITAAERAHLQEVTYVPRTPMLLKIEPPRF